MWTQRTAIKITRGDHSANHKPVRVVEDDKPKWLCTICGKLAKRPADLGITCTGCPGHGTCRYWRQAQERLSDHREGRPLTAGRNKPRSGVIDQPVEPGQIIRLLLENGGEARPAQGPPNQRSASTNPQGSGPPRATPKRKWIPQEV
eukprot:7544224-Heterocapsa_arctica.AAC.1